MGRGLKATSPTCRDIYVGQQVLDANYLSTREDAWVDLPHEKRE